MIEGISVVKNREETNDNKRKLYFGDVNEKGFRETGILGIYHDGKHLPVRWTNQQDDVTQMMWGEVTKNFWLDRDINFHRDVQTWANNMSELEKIAFIKVLTGLASLDSRQGTDGMGLIAFHEVDGQVQAVLQFNSMMEHIHAKFYSKAFQSLIPKEIINKYMEDWAMENKELQTKLDFIVTHYNNLMKLNPTKEEMWKAKASSVMLETALFYSGFYYPIALAGGIGSKNGEARMTNTADGISLIVRDENLHGQYIGWLAETNFHEWFDEEEKDELKAWLYDSLHFLYENEVKYTKEIYDPIGLTEDVLNYVRFNFNRVCMQLGFENIFPEEEINPVIENGIRIETATSDMFTMKAEYFEANVVPSTDDTFNIDFDKIVNQ